MSHILAALRELAALFTAIDRCLDSLCQLFVRNAAPNPAADVGERLEAADEAGLGDDFLYDTLARMNETVVGNIDTADLALLAVIGGTLAVLVFGIDKSRELAPPWEVVAYWFLGGSVAVCTCGYLMGFGSQREPVDPRSFAAAFSNNAEEAISTALVDVVLAYQTNARVRLLKRIGVAVALFLLIVGTVVAALARSIGAMV